MPLITFEGIDGCGKSTQIQKLKALLEGTGRKVYLFREPGGTPLSEEIRAILLDSNRTIHPVTEMILFSAARSDLITQQVQPLLQRGEWIILDRFYDSTTAYQGYGRKAVRMEELSNLNHLATNGVIPDLTFYLRVDRETASKRREGEAADRMEGAGDAFFERVIQGYDQIAEREPDRVTVLDASQPVEKVFDDLMVALKHHYGEID
ncbi:MAG: dTMP kinase [Bacteroidetes bacterium]|nr:MAG: dTMP kinase [Bacteroidota bacterium]